jgi:RNA polymerase sigma-70 factor (ECF subfamily)
VHNERLAARGNVPVADLEVAVHEHGPLLLAAARAITLDDAEAQDVVQTTFEIAIRHQGELRDPTATRAWLLRIETREAFRVARRLRRFIRVDPSIASLPVATPDAVESIVIRDALGALPRRMRATVVLHHMVGLSVAETAAALGTTDNTVKSQLKSALVRLREVLRDE